MTSTKDKIVEYLQSQPYWVSGTELERQAPNWETKASVISRRARELAFDGKIQRRLWTKRTVQYRKNYERIDGGPKVDIEPPKKNWSWG